MYVPDIYIAATSDVKCFYDGPNARLGRKAAT